MKRTLVQEASCAVQFVAKEQLHKTNKSINSNKKRFINALSSKDCFQTQAFMKWWYRYERNNTALLNHRARPESLMDCAGFHIQFWSGTNDFDGALTPCEDFPAGKQQMIWGGSYNRIQVRFAEGINYPSDVSPMNGSCAHCAWLRACVERPPC